MPMKTAGIVPHEARYARYRPPNGVRRMSGSLLCDLMVFLFTMVQDLIASFYNLFGLGTIEPLNIGSVLGCNL